MEASSIRLDLTQRYPQRALDWKLRTRTLTFTRMPALMGILNVTPDSFSDGGNWQNRGQAVDRALRMEDEGAAIIDIGGESTRPYSTPVDPEEELRRVLPVIEGLVGRLSIPISIDTTKAVVAKAALEAGAEIINDISGLETDPEMIEVTRDYQPGVCAMHMQGTPQTMQDNPVYQDVVTEIFAYLQERLRVLLETGIQRQQICLDPGIGFGKTHQHNLDLMAACDTYHALGCPLLVGHSRKGFLGKIVQDHQQPRVMATVGATLALAMQGVQVIRVHDVRENREALDSFIATGGLDGVPVKLTELSS